MADCGLQLDEWLVRLESYSPHEIDLGLDRMRQVLGRLQLKPVPTVIHVAGTNGKGSSVAMLEALLLHTGERVGCYTSPHIHRYEERIRVDGASAAAAEIVAAFAVVEAARGDLPLTYFEFGTLAALVVFAERDVAIAVLEIGLGGRLDAVNAIEPNAGLITSIALDHCDWLGNDLEAIAAEKAGIMRAGKPVVYAAKERPRAIDAAAADCGAKLFALDRDYRYAVTGQQWSWRGVQTSLTDLRLPGLVGDVQVQNAAGVLTVLEAAGFARLLDAATVNAALADLSVPGRAQRVADRYLLDVAHNPAAAAALAATVADLQAGPTTVSIIGMLADKDVVQVAQALDPVTAHWIAVTPDSQRALPAAELARRLANASDRPCWIAPSMQAALDRATMLADPTALILITGSFYTVEAALVILAAPDYGHG